MLEKVFGFLLALLEWEKFLAFMIESVFEIQVFFGKRDAFCHKNRIIYILIFLTAAGLLCFCPYPEKIDATLEGFYYEKNLLKLGASGTIHIHRTHYHYCLREDVFKGGTSF